MLKANFEYAKIAFPAQLLAAVVKPSRPSSQPPSEERPLKRSLSLSRALLAGSCVAFVTASALASDGTAVTTKSYELPSCAKPVASVMVGKLVCKAAACQQLPTTNNALLAMAMAQQQGPNLAAVGDGMGAMLTTVLKETGCFDIQDREAMEELAKELALVGKKMEVQQADFMIAGSITSISMNTERKALAGGFIPIIGAIAKTTKTAEIGLDIKVVDVNRGKIVEAKTFQANNETSSTSFGGGGVGPGFALGGGMQSIKGTPMEAIVRDILTQVASFTATRMVSARQATNAPAAAPSAESAAPSAAQTPGLQGAN